MKKINIIIILAIVFFSIVGNAQLDLSYHQSVNAFANELVARHIDTICVYEKFDEKKNPPYAQYIFWKENHKTYLKKFDQNEIYAVTAVKHDSLWKAIVPNVTIIKNEIVEPFAYIATANGKEQPFTIVNEATKVNQFKIYINGDITHGWYNSFDFLERDVIKNEMRKNIYHIQNNKLKGIRVVNMLEEIIADIEKNK